MPEAPLPNTTEARTETGEIKDATAISTTPETTPAPEPKVETKPDAAPAPEAKTEDKSLLNQKDEKAAAKAAPGAPEKYADFKAPEGFEIDKATLESALPVFKELGLGQDQAQKLVDFYATVSQKAADAPFQLWKETQQKWVDEIKADPEIGGKLDQVKATVSKAIDGLGDPKLANDFRAAMDYTGAGNNPAFIRAFYKLASKLSEGGTVIGGGPVGQVEPGKGQQSAAHRLFPNLP